MGLTHKGVNYDIGTNCLPDGVLSRGEWRQRLRWWLVGPTLPTGSGNSGIAVGGIRRC